MVEGTWGSEIHEKLTPQAGEPIVTKRGVSAFTASDLDQILRTKRIGTLILAGVATNFVVEGTARQACDLGYDTIVVGGLLRIGEPGGPRCVPDRGVYPSSARSPL